MILYSISKSEEVKKKCMEEIERESKNFKEFEYDNF
jgi:hypothetical protein